jgi:hypothetical protein
MELRHLTNKTSVVTGTERELCSNGVTGDRRMVLFVARNSATGRRQLYITTNGVPIVFGSKRARKKDPMVLSWAAAARGFGLRSADELRAIADDEQPKDGS